MRFCGSAPSSEKGAAKSHLKTSVDQLDEGIVLGKTQIPKEPRDRGRTSLPKYAATPRRRIRIPGSHPQARRACVASLVQAQALRVMLLCPPLASALVATER